MTLSGRVVVVVERKIHRGIKHVARAMTLNLPQALYDLNHCHLPALHPPPVPLSVPPFSNPRTSISRFSRNVPHLPWHFTPSRRRPGSRPLSLSLPLLHLHRSLHLPDTLFSRRSTISSRFTAYPVAHPLFSSSRSTELLYALLLSPSLSLLPSFLSPSPPSDHFSRARCRNFAAANFDLHPIAYTYRLRPIRRR